MQELVDMYNVGAGKKIKRFPKKQVGIDRIVGLMLKNLIEKPVMKMKKRASLMIHHNGNLCNADFAKLKGFKTYCEMAGIKPTRRQASKFRNKRGLAYTVA